MKKKKWLIFVLVLLIAVIVFAVCRLTIKEVIYLEAPDPDFYPEGYDFVLARFEDSSIGITVEPVEDYKDVAREGLRLIRKRNREVWGMWNQWLLQDVSITVFYVPEEDTWVWFGSCPCNLKEDDLHWLGCHPVVIMRQDGTVVADGSY